jgi:hypothetical protein
MRHACFFTVLVLFGCSSAEDVSKSRDEAVPDIHEAVFRHQFNNNPSALGKRAKAYFLRIREKDPDEAFLKRFEGHQPPVRPGSEWTDQDREALLFRVQTVKWIGDNTVEVRGSYYEHKLSSSGSLYRLVRQAGKWRVEKDEVQSIS